MNLRICLFLLSECLNWDLIPKKVAIKDNTCAIAPNLCHNANNLPLWTWWQHQDPRSFSPFVIKGKGLCSPWVYAEIFCADHAPPDCRQDLQEKKICSWRRIQDLPITIRLSTYIHHPTKWGHPSNQVEFIRNLHMMTKKYYIFIPGIVGKLI